MQLTDAHTHAVSPGADRIALVNLLPGEWPETTADNLFFSCGIHPADSGRFTLDGLRKTLTEVPCSAVGECGLDPLVPVEPELQEKVFMEQIRLSEELKLPLVIHCVRRYYDLIRIRKASSARMPWLIHGFRGKPEIGKALLGTGFLLSLSPEWLLHQTSFPAWLPRTGFLLETDEKSNLLAPVYEHTANLLNVSVEEFCRSRREIFQAFLRKEL